MNHGVMVIMAVLMVPLSIAYGETISVQDDYSSIVIQVDGDLLVTYSVSFTDRSETIGPTDPKLKTRSFGFLIIDKPSGFFAAVKNTDNGYEIKARINTGSETLVKEYVFEKMTKDDKQTGEKKPAEDEKKQAKPKNTDQRDLLGSTILVPDKDAKEKGTKPPAETHREEAKRLLDEALKKQEEQNENQLQSKKDEPNAVTSYEEYKKQTVTPTDVQTVPPANIKTFKLFTKVDHHVSLNEKLQYSVLVTDGDATTYSSKYSKDVGKGIPSIVIKSVIKDSKGKVLFEINGTTDKSGSLDIGPHTIPSQADKKKFVIVTSAIHKQSGKTMKTQDIFHTVRDVNGNYDGKPKAKATASATKINTDIIESIKVAIEKYKKLDGKLNHTTYDDGDFVDMSNPNSPKKLKHIDLMDLLRNSGHVKIEGNHLSWNFCWSSHVTLDASSSSDPENDELTYKWEFEGPTRYASNVDTMFSSTDPVSKAVINLTSIKSESFSFTLVANDLESDSEKEFVAVSIESDKNIRPVLCDLP